MKISSEHLEMALSKMRYKLLGYDHKMTLPIEIELIQDDPGNGAMTSILKLTAKAPMKEGDETETSMIIEIFPENDNQAPRGSVIESFAIKTKY